MIFSSLFLLLNILFLRQSTSSLVCNIQTYGAKTSSSDNTVSIQNAINACLNGGTVQIPTGTWNSYPLTIKGGTNFVLQLDTGAVLAAGPRSNWPVSNSAYTDFLTVSSCAGCTIQGTGTIDGGGTPWYEEFDQGILMYHRPFLLVVSKCTDFKLLHVTLLNSPMFNLVLNQVTRGEVGWVTIRDDWYNNGSTEPHNTDGIDPGDDSNNLHIHDCYIYNGDDSIAVKPGTTAGGCTRDILVENCEFHRGHGCSIGSIGSGCIKNVMFRNINIYDQMGGCVVKAYNDGAGSVTNITWKGITMSNTKNCIQVNTQYKSGTSTPGISISGLHYQDVTGTGCTYAPQFSCQSGKPCSGITMNNVNVPAGSQTMTCSYASGSTTGTMVPKSCLTASSILSGETASDNNDANKAGISAGIAVGILLFVVLVAVIVVVYWRRRQRTTEEIV